MGETNVLESDIIASRDGYLSDTPEMRCYILCIFEHAGMIEDDGTIHFQQVLHMLTPGTRATAEFVVKECATIREHFFTLQNELLFSLYCCQLSMYSFQMVQRDVIQLG